MRQILITKANGVMEPFDVSKLESSLRRSGASQDQVEYVVKKITRRIKPGDTTSRIYREAFQVLKKMEKGVAARYSLRRSLAELGPSGFPFEIFVAKLFESMGFQTKVGLHLRGKCIEHEVDLIGWNDTKFVMGEVKFHNNSDLKNDSKTVMYVHARYEDLKRSEFNGMQAKELKPEGWLITNTKFTQTTIQYASCYGLKLMGWNYPDNELNLQNIIESSGLEPVTILTTLTQAQKRLLLNEGIVLCDQLEEEKAILNKIGINKRKQSAILNELREICNCNDNCKHHERG